MIEARSIPGAAPIVSDAKRRRAALLGSHFHRSRENRYGAGSGSDRAPYRLVSQNSLQETGMKRITIFSLIAAIFFSLVAGDRRSVAQSPRPGLPTARPEDVGMSSERLGRIRTGMRRYVDSGMVP